MLPEVKGVERLEEVGRGGFGVVYKGWQPEFARFVAVKVLPPDRGDADTKLRIEREALALGSLSGHPNIVAIHSAGITADGEPYFVMPFLSGGSLDDRIALSGPRPWAEVVDIGVKVAAALHTAHNAGVLHRDVKPDNVLFSEFGEPQLADFGIARIAGRQHTQGGAVATTILFAAPEVLAGADPTPSADIYSLACTMYAALVGRAPFASDNNVPLATTIARVATEPARRPAVQLPDSLWAVLARGLSKNPSDRAGSAAEFGKALQRVQRVEGQALTPLVVPAGSAGDDEATVLLHGAPQNSGENAATVHLRGDHPLPPPPPPPHRPSQPAPPARSRRRLALLALAFGVVVLGLAGVVILRAADSNDRETEAGASSSSSAVTTSSVPTTTSAPAATTSTTGITAERPTQGVDLFNGAIQALTPFNGDLAVIAVSSSGEIESPENEAALLGSWYSLSDWCVAEGHGREGVCYDLAADFLVSRFDRDPRTINDDTWPGSGAIGGVIDSGYNITQGYLGLPELQPPTFEVTSNGNRPGQDILCEPSCTAVLDG